MILIKGDEVKDKFMVLSKLQYKMKIPTQCNKLFLWHSIILELPSSTLGNDNKKGRWRRREIVLDFLPNMLLIFCGE